jgi:tRNA-Thr(GGU) m(6)t(6)A37 methyltransferase TsaA
MTFTIRPIATVHNQRDEVADDDWGEVISRIELAPDVAPESIAGLEDFSHVEVLFVFDRVPDGKIEYSARHPRNNTAWPKVGIFAQRGKNRPNRIGLCTAEIIQRDGRELIVKGLDAIDGTPVIDLKPVMTEFLPRGVVRQPRWSSELMARYWKKELGG